MTEMISKDQAVIALALAFQFEGKLEMYTDMAKFNEDATQSGTHYALIEMAGVVEQIEAKLPEGGLDAAGPETFYGYILHEFDYTKFPVPHLTGTVDEVAAKFIEEFQLDQAAVAPGM
jgi:hypothetical protein